MTSFVHLFAKHRVAANLLMVVMINAGLIGVDRYGHNFSLSFDLDIVTISVLPGLARQLKTCKSVRLFHRKFNKRISAYRQIDATSQFGFVNPN